MSQHSGRAALYSDDNEFVLLPDNAAEAGLPWNGDPKVRREYVDVDGLRLSAIVWGDDPEVVFVHGGSQNAHTWDTTVLALGRSALAIDLPGHGRSGWRDDHDYHPITNADAIAPVIAALAPNAQLQVGMSLGGLTSIALTARHAPLVKRLAIVDVTPGVNSEKSKAISNFVNGPQAFPDFEQLLARTMEHNPTRSESSMRRGILHNARQLPDGSWQWRYDRTHGRLNDAAQGKDFGFTELWDDVSRISQPTMLLYGEVRLAAVVWDDDLVEFRKRMPNARVEFVEGAGHSLQGDQPVELARLLNDFLATT